MKKAIGILLTVIMISALCSGCSRKKEGWRIALITMDSVDQHWLYCKAGADKAAEELGCTVDFLAPPVIDDALSIELLNNAVAAEYDAILYAPVTPEASKAALREADEAGIKIIYIDSAASYPAEVGYGTDGYKGGISAAENMLAILNEKGIANGKIGVVSVNESLVSNQSRALGFIDTFRNTDFEIMEIQYSGGNASLAQTICENYITQGVVGIFGTNEGNSIGIGNAIKASGKDVVGIGFDTSDAILQLVNAGYIKGIVYQRPQDMGYYGVKAAVDILENGTDYKGEFIDTGIDVKLYDGK